MNTTTNTPPAGGYAIAPRVQIGGGVANRLSLIWTQPSQLDKLGKLAAMLSAPSFDQLRLAVDATGQPVDVVPVADWFVPFLRDNLQRTASPLDARLAGDVMNLIAVLVAASVRNAVAVFWGPGVGIITPLPPYPVDPIPINWPALRPGLVRVSVPRDRARSLIVAVHWNPDGWTRDGEPRGVKSLRSIVQLAGRDALRRLKSAFPW